MPLQTPWVDVRSVGAGGGSIAYVDQGLLHVGPRSAGAEPGPVVLRPRRHRADRDRRRRDARHDRSADAGQRPRARRRRGPSGDRRGSPTSSDSTPTKAAQGVLRVASASMAGAMRAVSVEVGEDPRERGADRLRRRRPAVRVAAGARARHRDGRHPELRRQLLRLGPARAGRRALRRADDRRHRSTATASRAPRRRCASCSRSSTSASSAGVAGDGRRTKPSSTCATRAGVHADRAGRARRRPHRGDAPDDIAARFAAAYERNYGHTFDGRGGDRIRARDRAHRCCRGRPNGRAGRPPRRPPPAARPSARSRSSAANGATSPLSTATRWRPGDTFDGPAIVLETTTTSYFDDGFARRRARHRRARHSRRQGTGVRPDRAVKSHRRPQDRPDAQRRSTPSPRRSSATASTPPPTRCCRAAAHRVLADHLRRPRRRRRVLRPAVPDAVADPDAAAVHRQPRAVVESVVEHYDGHGRAPAGRRPRRQRSVPDRHAPVGRRGHRPRLPRRRDRRLRGDQGPPPRRRRARRRSSPRAPTSSRRARSTPASSSTAPACATTTSTG